ncbi:hypothetical protein LCGC14_2937410, partial [marine sediment metagenome]
AKRGAGLAYGLALSAVGGAAAAPVIGRVVLRAGAGAVARGLSPKVIDAAARVSKGAFVGSTFGATFGTIRPLVEGEERSDAIMNDAILGGIFVGAFDGAGPLAARGIRAIFGSTKKPISLQDKRKFLGEITRGLTEGDAEQAGFAFGRTRDLLPPEALSGEELAAQVAAGLTKGSSTFSGYVGKAKEAYGAAVLPLAQMRDKVTRRWPEVGRSNPELVQMAKEFVNANGYGAWVGRTTSDILFSGHGKRNQEIIMKAISASRLRAAAARNREIALKIRMEKGAEQIQLLDNPVTGVSAGRSEPSKDIVSRVNRLLGEAKKLDDWAGDVLSFEERKLILADRNISGTLELIETSVDPTLKHFFVRNGGTSMANTELPFI